MSRNDGSHNSPWEHDIPSYFPSASQQATPVTSSPSLSSGHHVYTPTNDEPVSPSSPIREPEIPSALQVGTPVSATPANPYRESVASDRFSGMFPKSMTPASAGNQRRSQYGLNDFAESSRSTQVQSPDRSQRSPPSHTRSTSSGSTHPILSVDTGYDAHGFSDGYLPARKSTKRRGLADKVADKVMDRVNSVRGYKRQSVASTYADQGIVLEDVNEDMGINKSSSSTQKGRYQSANIEDLDSDEENFGGFDLGSYGGGPVGSTVDLAAPLSPTVQRQEQQLREQRALSADYFALEAQDLQDIGMGKGLGSGMLTAASAPLRFRSQRRPTAMGSGGVSRSVKRDGLTRGQTVRDVGEREARERGHMVAVVGMFIIPMGPSTKTYSRRNP
jgi:hypothetical protein